MANIEKHQKHPLEQLDQADVSVVPTHARAAQLIGRYIKNQQNDGSGCSREERTRSAILRLEDLPATPSNIARIRKRVRLLNRRLAASGTPFRLRII